MHTARRDRSPNAHCPPALWGWGTAASWVQVPQQVAAPEPWDIVGLLAMSPGKAWCQEKRQHEVQLNNLFSRLPWDPLLNDLEQAVSWQGTGPAPQARVQCSTWEPGAPCRLQGLAASPASLTQLCTQASQEQPSCKDHAAPDCSPRLLLRSWG